MSDTDISSQLKEPFDDGFALAVVVGGVLLGLIGAWMKKAK